MDGFATVALCHAARKVSINRLSARTSPTAPKPVLGHIADSQFGLCATAAGEKPPQSGIEKTKTSKADLTKAIIDSNAYCNQVIDAMNDQKGMEVIKFFTGPSPRLAVLGFNVAHSYEHYGNLVTYLRLNKIVPPSSEGK